MRVILEEALAPLGSLGGDGAGHQQSGEGEDADHFSGCEESRRGGRRLKSGMD